MNKRRIDERFIAKTKPRKDIQWHTDDLLHNLERLRELYPNLKIDWDILRLACIYHDLGKMYIRFQECVHGRSNSTGIPHGFLSLGFIDVEYLEAKGYDEKDIEALFQAVAYHHERDADLSMREIFDEIETMGDAFKDFEYSQLPTRYFEPEFDTAFFKLEKRFYESRDGEYFFKVIMLKGLLNRLDYAASAEISVECPNDFLVDSMDKLLEKWRIEKPETEWNSLQKYMLEHQEENIVAIAQTGMGKTEAGLLWLGDNKGFFTLPLKSAINAIYKRIINNIVKEKMDDRVALLHSDTLKVYFEQKEERNKEKDIITEAADMELETYYTRTKQLSLPLTICTLDQIFDFVYRYKGFEHKLATLSYSKIIIDEIQMYSPDLVAYLIIGLTYVTRLGGKFAILTATLPGLILDFLKKENIKFLTPKIFTNSLVRHSVKKVDALIDDDGSIDQMAAAFDKNKLLIICNTIKKAKVVYSKLKAALKEKDKVRIHLLHSGFIRSDRAEKEERIMAVGKKDSIESEVWVTTQLVEASLDIDFDLLYTELSDLNGLFQRMGRCYRNRPLDREYNCFVFTGGDKKCSGVGENSVIEPQIHDFSKTALAIDGELDEKTKIEMIENTYSTEKLKGTKYHSEIKKTIQYMKDISSYEFSKKDVTKMFRDIDQVSVIPLCIYKKFEEEIVINIEILRGKTKDRLEKVKAREYLRDLMVPVHRRLADGTVCKLLKVDKSLEIIIVDAQYNYEMGIDFEKTKNKDFRDVESRMF